MNFNKKMRNKILGTYACYKYDKYRLFDYCTSDEL